MPQFLVYEVKVAVVMAVFYLFFRLLLSREKLHRLNRCVLVGTVALSFLLPLCVITVHRTAPVQLLDDVAAGPAAEVLVAAEIPDEPFNWWPVLTAIYLSGIAIVMLKAGADAFNLLRLISNGEKHGDSSGSNIVVLDKDIAPFSWMHYIFLSREDYEAFSSHIMEHERAHIRLGHSPELMVVEIFSALQWFNPAMWLLKSDLKALYEYEADDAVLRKGADIKEYQYSLIRKAVGASGYSITNSFNHSILKNRITMMSKTKAPRMGWLRALYVLPLVCGALVLNARTVTDCEVSEIPHTVQESAVKVGIKIENGEPVYLVEGERTSVDKIRETVLILIKEGKTPTFRLSGVSDVNGTDGFTSDILSGLGDAMRNEFGEGYKSVLMMKEEIVGEGEHIVQFINKELPRPGNTEEELVGYKDLTKKPQFNGGDAQVFPEWVTNNLPIVAQDSETLQSVLVSFVVNSEGKVSNVTILRGFSEDIDAAVKECIGSSPVWTPGEVDGKPVATSFVFPVVLNTVDYPVTHRRTYTKDNTTVNVILKDKQ